MIAAGVVCLLWSVVFFGEAYLDEMDHYGPLLPGLACLYAGILGVTRNKWALAYIASVTCLLLLMFLVPAVACWWYFGPSHSMLDEFLDAARLFWPITSASVLLLLLAECLSRAVRKRKQSSNPE